MSIIHKGTKIASNAVTGDTLPIGSVVEISDGTPVPVGYEQVDDGNLRLLYAGTGDSGNLQPYITCYMWKRII